MQHAGDHPDDRQQCKKHPKFADAITRAKQKIENFASEKLFDPKAPTKGVMFSLSNNAEGWAEKREQTVKLPKDGADELAKRMLGVSASKPDQTAAASDAGTDA